MILSPEVIADIYSLFRSSEQEGIVLKGTQEDIQQLERDVSSDLGRDPHRKSLHIRHEISGKWFRADDRVNDRLIRHVCGVSQLKGSDNLLLILIQFIKTSLLGRKVTEMGTFSLDGSFDIPRVDLTDGHAVGEELSPQ